MKKLFLSLLLIIGLPCYANTTDELNYINRYEKVVLEHYCKVGNKCDKAFSTYYKLLLNKIPELSSSEWGDNLKCDKNYNCVLYPKTPVIRYEYNDWTGMAINYPYLIKTFSPYLSQEWKDYLNTFADEYYIDATFGVWVTKEKNILQFQKWYDFILKHPKFRYNYYLEECMKTLKELLEESQRSM